MKKGLLILLLFFGALFLGFSYFGPLEEAVKVSEIPLGNSNIKDQKEFLCNSLEDETKKQYCNALIYNMVYTAYAQGKSTILCHMKEQEDPDFMKDQREAEFCDRANNLLDELYDGPNNY